jgi:integrase
LRQPLKDAHGHGIRDWTKAQQRVREIEAEGFAGASESPTITDACDRFIADAEARQLREPTIYKYRLLFRQLQEFANANGLVFISDFNLEWVRKFRESWKNRNVAARKKLEALKSFFRFATDSGWLEQNPAAKLKPPKTTDPPTIPFTADQYQKILKACDQYPEYKDNKKRIRALVLLLRHSGLRIRDAVTLPRNRVNDGKLLLYTAKTGTPVYCPLPPDVLRALDRCPGKEFYFWTGESKPKSAVGDWQRALKKLFTLAKVPDGHAHRFRDTFCVELLLKDVPIETVSVLLGHQSVRITEKHYAPWVHARQEQLEAAVKRTWGKQLGASDGHNLGTQAKVKIISPSKRTA